MGAPDVANERESPHQFGMSVLSLYPPGVQADSTPISGHVQTSVSSSGAGASAASAVRCSNYNGDAETLVDFEKKSSTNEELNENGGKKKWL